MRNLNNVPKIISESKSIGHSIDFTWNKKKIEKFLDPLNQNEELENALMHINHNGSVGLTAALLEWVYWRFTGYTQSTQDTQKRIEALWCSINDREQTNPLLFDTNLDIPAVGCIDGVLWIALMNVRMVDVRYRKGSYFLQNELLGLVLLARHITPKKKIFDKWLGDVLSNLIRLYPCPYNFNDLDESDEAIYDSSNEPKICREFFFDSQFNYSREDAGKALHHFIENLDHKANPFLHLTRKAS